MQQFDYRAVTHVSVNGNQVTIDTYNKGMEPKDDESKEEPKEEPKDDDKKSDNLPKESVMKLGKLIKEITKDEQAAEIDAAKAEIEAAKKKEKAATEASKEAMKKAKDKIMLAKKQEIEEGHHGYTFGTGDIVKNINTKCPHHGSQGVVKHIETVPGVGTIAVYTVTNNGKTFKAGDSLTKTIDQLAPIQALDDDIEEKLVYYKDKKDRLRRFDTDKSANKKYEK
jgi:hypothetical protein